MLLEILQIARKYWILFSASFSITLLSAYFDFQVVTMAVDENLETLSLIYLASLLLFSSILKIVVVSLTQVFINIFCQDETKKILNSIESKASMIDNDTMAALSTNLSYKLSAIAGSIMAIIDSFKSGVVLAILVVIFITEAADSNVKFDLNSLLISLILISVITVLAVYKMAKWGASANNWLNKLNYNISLVHTNQVDILLNKNHYVVEHILSSQIAVRRFQALLQLLIQNFRYILEVLALLLVIALSENTNGGAYMLFVTLLFFQRFLPTFQSFVNGFFTISASKAAIRELIVLKNLRSRCEPHVEVSLSHVNSFTFHNPQVSPKISATINQEVCRGQILKIDGHSGAGKSTYLLQLCGIIETAGCIVIGNKEFFNHKIVSTFFSNNQTKVYGTTLSEYFDTDDEESVVKMLVQLGVAVEVCAQLRGENGQFFHTVQNLSSGELQRIKLVKAACSNADLVVLDEPFSALDHDRRLLARKFVERNLSDKFVVLVDHGDINENSSP